MDPYEQLRNHSSDARGSETKSPCPFGKANSQESDDTTSDSFVSFSEESETYCPDADRRSPKNPTNSNAVSVPDAGAVVKVPRSSPRHPTFFDLTREFVSCFTELHLDREIIAGLYVCVTCQHALETLKKIRTAIRNDPQGRQAILNNALFMKLLLKLCELDSTDGPRICTVNAVELKQFYKRGGHRLVRSSVEILKDKDITDKCWKELLGRAAESIYPSTYVIRLGRVSKLPWDSSCSWTKEHPGSEVPRDQLLKGDTYQRKSAADAEDCQLYIVGCLDAGHVWAYFGKDVAERVRSLGESLSVCQFSLTSDAGRRKPNVGDILGFVSSSEDIQRVVVLRVEGDMAYVWAMDNGQFHKAPWASMMNLPPSFKHIAPLVSLCILKGTSFCVSTELEVGLRPPWGMAYFLYANWQHVTKG